MVARGHAQPGVAVDDARGPGCDRDIGQQPRHQAGTDGRAVHRRDHRLVAVDDVVDQVARFVPHARAGLEIVGHVFHQRQVAAGGEALALAADQRHADVGIGGDVAPDLGQLAVHVGVGSGQLLVGRLRRTHDDLEDGAVAAQRQRAVARVAFGKFGKFGGRRVVGCGHGWPVR
ncbi:hypothetical protein FQZ97_931920 [compost metagenome]